MSFAARFNYRFPTHPGYEESRNEVPVSMVALVATAVSKPLFHMCSVE
jgi:hypothetical protein